MSDESEDDDVLNRPAFSSSRNEHDIVSQPHLEPQQRNIETPALVDLTSEVSSRAIETDIPPGEIVSDETHQATSSTSNLHDNKMSVAEKTVQYCLQNDITDPVEVLRCLQLNMVTGRPLEVQHTNEEVSGETNFIMVDRQNLLQTALDEIHSLTDFRKTLEVQFYDEVMTLAV